MTKPYAVRFIWLGISSLLSTFHSSEARLYHKHTIAQNAIRLSTSFHSGNIASCLLFCERIGEDCQVATFNDLAESRCSVGSFDLSNMTGIAVNVFLTDEAVKNITGIKDKYDSIQPTIHAQYFFPGHVLAASGYLKNDHFYYKKFTPKTFDNAIAQCTFDGSKMLALRNQREYYLLHFLNNGTERTWIRNNMFLCSKVRLNT